MWRYRLLVTCPVRKVSTPVSPLPSTDLSSSGTLESSILPRRVRLLPSGSVSGMLIDRSLLPAQRLHPVDGHGKDDGGVLLRRDLGQGLQVAQVQGDGLGLQRCRRFRELLGGLQLAGGVDDLGPLLPLRL